MCKIESVLKNDSQKIIWYPTNRSSNHDQNYKHRIYQVEEKNLSS